MCGKDNYFFWESKKIKERIENLNYFAYDELENDFIDILEKMKKIDKESTDDNILPLLSQNISIIEVGAYAHIFKPLIDFFGIKTLIITDIDSADIKNIGDTKKNGDKYTKKTIIIMQVPNNALIASVNIIVSKNKIKHIK